MTRFTGWLAQLDHPTTDGRILVGPSDGPGLAAVGSVGLIPVLGPAPGPMRSSWVGEVREVWVEDGWLRGNGEVNIGALPIAYRGQAKLGAEIDVDGGTAMTVWRGDEQQLILRDWTLRAVTIGDRPAWPDARLELER